MVRLYVSLLAVALAAGPALAFSDEYERRSELDGNLYEREFVDSQEMPISRQDHEYFYGREASDDFEAREPINFGLFKSAAIKAKNLAKKKLQEHLHGKKASPTQAPQDPSLTDDDPSRRELSDRLKIRREELDSREFAEFLEARRGRGGGGRGGPRGPGGHPSSHRGSTSPHQGPTDQEPIDQGSPPKKMKDRLLDIAEKGVTAYVSRHDSRDQYSPQYSPQYNDYDKEFKRDLDAEELFGREFDDLDERDIFDDLD